MNTTMIVPTVAAVRIRIRMGEVCG